MNTTQIKCFLAVAETLNFTRAAEQLFISQPGLSRQIVSLEQELNTILFIRDKHKVSLTPAAAVLAQELKGFNNRVEEIVHKVQRVGQGYAGTLTIGMLGGQFAYEDLTAKIMGFMEENPHIDLSLKQGSFRDLREWLAAKEIDIAVTLDFDIQGMDGVVTSDFYKDVPVFAISRHTKTGRKRNITLDDLTKETLIVISPDDSRPGYELALAFVKRKNLHFADIRYAPNLATVMMLVEVGQGTAMINHFSTLTANTSIRLLDNIKIAPDDGSATCFAWMRDNYNPAIPLFTN